MKKKININIPNRCFLGKRLDQILAYFLKGYSRSFLKKCILQNKVFINDQVENHPDKKIFGGEKIFFYPPPVHDSIDSPENINLDIIYEDEDILVINKPVGLIVHPGAGHQNGTLLNALLYHYINIKYIPRAGIVHRLDKNTSGLMVIAKTMIAYKHLLILLKKRKIIRKYQAIVHGVMISGGVINEPIMRHHTQRTRMTVNHAGKKSVTYYKVIQRFSRYTHISVQLDTGRTHQIRVHMLYIGYPLVGDHVYFNRVCRRPIINMINKDIDSVYMFPRQALHSYSLSFSHPITKVMMKWVIPLPKDMRNLLKCL
ncbi:Ribosomal large subunit pseudouridine synthase D [Buchnera aphidicola (Cavariella theobaldi)]